jgi:iron complex outermembrane receptor protein
MVNGGYYASEYGMPSAVGVQRARYWRFQDWDRYTLNAGGFTSLGGDSTLRFRAFLVNYKNTLDQYKDAAMTVRQFESTFDNSVYGAFALADLALSGTNSLKLSLNFQKDFARTQDDVGLPFIEYDQGTFSAAVEDHLSLSAGLKLVGGLSLDVIDKFTGGTASRLNPLAGIKVTPSDDLDFHLSLAQKSRLPNMRALYSSTSGNPDLLSETGTNGEIGVNWNGPLPLSASAFLTSFKNMIDTMTLADGTRRYWNVGKARINGFEIQAGKAIGRFEGTLNYTYLDHRNETSDRPLDALSAHTLSFDLTARPLDGLRLSLYGLYASASDWYDSTANKLLGIPEYFNLDIVAAYETGRTEIFLKATNIFNDYIYSEPIFPWRARYFEAGAKFRVF